MILFETISPGVVIPVGVGIVDDVLPGFVKTALHFAAGFMAPPPAATIAALRPGILRERPIRVLRQLPFRAPYFDPTGPVRHEVTIYPNGAHAVATIMLFSSMTATLELPHFGTREALRYVQLLDGTGPQLVDVDPIPIPHGPLSEREWDGLFATAHAKVYQIFVDRANREVDEMAKAASRVAMGHDAVHPGAFLRWFRAELECKAIRAELVDDLVRQAQRRILRGLPVMDDADMVLR